ncbi:MAG: hypothetical protein KDA75_03135 [Planctomycetaceae bacterium]|nr:hypothetical protein [Planctomycetaceae bacterium]
MPPEWLQELVNELTAHIEPADRRAPIGCHVCHADGIWEVTLFVSRTEVFGGEFDGEVVPGRFVMDVAGLFSVIEQLEHAWWQPLPAGPEDDLGPHLSLEGTHHGVRLWVRITAEQPAAIPSGRVANVIEGVIERRW